jgi:hypothetical protein
MNNKDSLNAELAFLASEGVERQSPRVIDGLSFIFHRRRYDNRVTYSWAYVAHGAGFLPLGDPWPCITPKGVELVAAARLAIARVDCERAAACARILP